jgi:two-component system sensor kinase FixL
MENGTTREVEGGGGERPPRAAGPDPAQEQALFEPDLPEAVVNALPGSFFVVAPDGRMLRWNQNFETLAEYSAQEIRAMRILNFVVEEHREAALQAMTTALAQGGSEAEVDCRTKSGRVLAFHVTARRVCLGGTTCLVGTGFDITKRKQMQEAYHALVDHSLQGLLIIQDMRIVFANRAIAEASGYSVEELLRLPPESVRNLVHAEDRERIWGQHGARLRGEHLPERQEFRAVGKDGSVCWLEIHTSRVNYQGRPAIQAACVDITKRRQAEEALRYRLQLEELVAGLSTDFISLSADKIDGEIKRWLARIGETLDIDRISVFQVPGTCSEIRTIHSWAKAGLKRAPVTLPSHSFDWCLQQLREGEILAHAHIEDLPPEAHSEKEYCRREGMQSVLAIPLAVAGSMLGVVVFSAMHRRRDWSDGLPQRLRLVGEIFANALLRKRAEETLHREHSLVSRIMDTSPAGIVLANRAGRILFANACAERILGLTKEEITQRTYNAPQWHITDYEGRPIPDEALPFSRVMSTGEPAHDVRLAISLPDGRRVLLRVNAAPVYDESDQIDGMVAAIEDVTEQVRAEESLRQSEEQFRGIFENAVLGLYRTTPDGRILMANPSLVHMLGYSSFEDIAMWNLEKEGYQPGYSRREFRERIESQGQLVGFESAWTKRDGTALFVRENARVVRDPQGKTLYYEGTVEDITEKKRTEKNLRELREIINRSPVLVFLWRVVPGQWPVEFVSENVERSLEYTAEDFLSGRVSWPGITHPDDVPRLEAEVAQYLAEGRTDWSQEYRLITRSGAIRWFRDQNLALPDAEGRVTRIQSIVLDITEHKRMEDALHESRRKYRDLYEGSRDGTAAGDLAGRLLHANSVFLDMLGYTATEIGRLTYRDITPARWLADEERIVHEQVYTRDYSDVFEKEYIRKDGSVFPVEVRIYLSRDNAGAPVGTWALVRDITERKKAEAQAQQHLAELTRAWHANTLGEMASGLAHELNQPLCAILNYSGGCLRRARKEQLSIDTLRGPMEQIAVQAQRAADIIKRIRGLIAKRELQRAELDIESLLKDVLGLLQSEADRNGIILVSSLANHLPLVRGDRVELEQVVLNLMRNGMEAMSEVNVARRVLTVSTSQPDRAHVEVAVTDTGRGVSPELAERVFESFFTTKHEGLGIGLSLSRRIVEAHGGRLWVESDGRSGATFRFTLPVEGVEHGEGESGCLCGG